MMPGKYSKYILHQFAWNVRWCLERKEERGWVDGVTRSEVTDGRSEESVCEKEAGMPNICQSTLPTSQSLILILSWKEIDAPRN